MSRDRLHLLLMGAASIALAALALWAISADVQTSVVETVRRRRVIGDAMAPMTAAGLLLFGGVLLLAERPAAPLRLSREGWAFAAAVAAILALSLLLMRWTGPATVEALRLAGAELPDYRALRDTRPWSWLGYLAGGTALVGGLHALVALRLGWRSAVLGLGVTVFLAAAYDLPFRNLILPPNGGL